METVYIVALVVLLMIGIYLIWSFTPSGKDSSLSIGTLIQMKANQSATPTQKNSSDVVMDQKLTKGSYMFGKKGVKSTHRQFKTVDSTQEIRD